MTRKMLREFPKQIRDRLLDAKISWWLGLAARDQTKGGQNEAERSAREQIEEGCSRRMLQGGLSGGLHIRACVSDLSKFSSWHLNYLGEACVFRVEWTIKAGAIVCMARDDERH